MKKTAKVSRKAVTRPKPAIAKRSARVPAPKSPAKPKASKSSKPAKKAVKKSPVVKSTVRTVPAPAKPAKSKTAPVVTTAVKSLAKTATKGAVASARKATPPPEPPPMKCILSKKDLEHHRGQLLKLRDRIVDEISFLANDSLNRSQKDSSGDLSSHSFHMADQGTDNFDREFAASLLSSEQDVLYEIDEALRRIDQGTYGICEMSGKPIEKERLKFLPFARYSVAVQSEMERGRPRYRPFRRTSIQQTSESTS